MKGTNMLKLNQATLVEALQRYLNTEMPGHTVRSVNVADNNYFSSGDLLADVVVIVDAPATDTAGRSE